MKITDDTISRPGDGLSYMREKSFIYVVLIIMLIGFFAFIVSILNALQNDKTMLVIVDIAGYLGVILIAFGSKITPLKVRFYFFIYLSLFLGIMFLFIEGPTGAGLMYIVAFNILSAVFLGLSSVFFSTIVSAFVLIIIILVIHFNLMPSSPINKYGTFHFALVSINVILISSISFVLALLVNNLGKTVKHKERLQKILRENVERLTAAKKKAEESDRLKSSFLANMSHEIRTPMNAIMGFSDLVLNQPNITVAESKDYVKTIYDSGDYLMTIIGNILDVSLIDSHQLKISLDDVNISSVFEDLEALYHPRVRDNNFVKLRFLDATENAGVTLNTDEQRLKQVLKPYQ